MDGLILTKNIIHLNGTKIIQKRYVHFWVHYEKYTKMVSKFTLKVFLMITMTSNFTEKKQRINRMHFFPIMIFNHMRLLDANSNKSKGKICYNFILHLKLHKKLFKFSR